MASSSLVDTLTASGGSEPAAFLNDLVTHLWPNLSTALSNILKTTVEPVLASTLPGPLSKLRFTKIDLGHAPLRLSNVDVHKVGGKGEAVAVSETGRDGVKLDLDVQWDSVCDVELDGAGVPKIGIEKARLKARLTVLLAPLTNVIPLMGAAQIAFINPPDLILDFTDAANIADSFLIKSTVRNTILNIISGILVLPNRILVNLASDTDFFATHQPHLGVLRLTINRATGIAAPKKESRASRLLAKIVKDVPDCYVKVAVGAEAEWRTKTQKNNHTPQWNETHDFLVADFEQRIMVDVQDDDLAGDDDIGIGFTTIKEVLLNGGTHELPLSHKGESTGATLAVRAQFFHLVADAARLSAQNSGGSPQDGDIVGLATVLVASAGNLQGERDALNPSVQVTYGDAKFRTAAKTYAPGTDIFNPAFNQAFRIPLTGNMLAKPGIFVVSLMDKEAVVGRVEVAFREVLEAPGLVREGSFDVGGGAVVRASVAVKGIQLAA